MTLAARIVGLDIAGVDLVAEDISRPLDEQRGAIVEVNAGPGLLMHLKPADGTPPWAGPSSTTCSPKATPAASPSSASPAPTARPWSRLIARLLYLSGKRTGLACSEGLYLDRRLVQKGDRADFASGTRVLMNRNVDAAVIENDSSVILGQGLAYDRCQVGVVTNIDDADHLGDFDINDAERMFNVFRTQVDVVLPGGYTVLNARDPRVVEMAELSDGAVIFFGIDRPARHRRPSATGWPRRVRARRRHRAGAGPARGTPGRRGRDPADPRRPRGLPGRACWPPSARPGRWTFRWS